MTRYEIRYTKTQSYNKFLTLIIEAESDVEALKIASSEDLDGLFSENNHENMAIIDTYVSEYDPEPLESIQLDSIEELKE
ncbi:MAG TPA: hypothetical protein DD612_01145 [Methylophilaceae bacterium]|nr:hypothetical protein [Methylophilaceae bacterium]